MNANALRFGLAVLAAGTLLCAGAASAQIKINEIRIDHTGTDTDEYFELIGTPGASLTGLTYVVIGDASAPPTCGTIECVADLTGYSLQADGLLCLSNSNAIPVLTGYDGSIALAFENSDNVTHLLVSGFTGALDQDLDTNDDGVLDVTPWTSIVDCVGFVETSGVPNCSTDEYLYCATQVGPDGTFVPGHIYRYSDTQAWAIGIFALGTTDTPGAPNFSQFAPPPLFTDMTRTPCVPTTAQQPTIVALVENDPTSAELRYRVNGGAETAVAMTEVLAVDDSVYYQATIPAQGTNGALVEYYCYAWNSNPNPTRSLDQGYFAGTMNVADLRANDVNGNNLYRFYGARVRGHVTSAYDVFGGTNTDFNLQDATGGINVFKFGPHLVQPALGDDITVAGSLEQFNGRLELSVTGSCDTVLITIHGAGSPPAPLDVSLCDLREQHEGLLVRVQDLVINTYEHTQFAPNWNYKAANCYTDSLELFVDTDTDIPGNAITTSHLEVVGIAGQYDTSSPYTWWYQVQPRALADITFLSMTSVPAPATSGGPWLGPCAPNPLTAVGEIRFRVPAGAADGGAVPVRLAVFDLSGRLVTTLVDGPVPAGTHAVALDRGALGAGNGVYFYRLRVGSTTLTRTLIAFRP
jgi:hypothetical protein